MAGDGRGKMHEGRKAEKFAKERQGKDDQEDGNLGGRPTTREPRKLVEYSADHP